MRTSSHMHISGHAKVGSNWFIGALSTHV